MDQPPGHALATPVAIDPQMPLRDYWLARAAQHTSDAYLGLNLSKFPEDLRAYEQLLWLAAPQVVIELGVQFGASTLWFRDRLRTLEAYGRVAHPHVIAADIKIDVAIENLARVDPSYAETITLLEGDVRDPALRETVGRLVPPGARCMVIEDSAHTYETTRSALDLYADLVPVGGWFVVEDGCVDVEWMRLTPSWPRGVLAALHEWLETDAGRAFRVARELNVYGISCHPSGFLQRIS